jgi:hypothetical protein
MDSMNREHEAREIIDPIGTTLISIRDGHLRMTYFQRGKKEEKDGV